MVRAVLLVLAGVACLAVFVPSDGGNYAEVGFQGVVDAAAMDLPESMRTRNRPPDVRSAGSCVHCSTISLLKWQGQHEMAAWWRDQYSGGEYDDRLIKRMESAGLRYAYTEDGDMGFIEWAVKTRRGAGVFYKPSHAINVVGMDSENVYLLDNNRVGEYEAVPRSEFAWSWKNRYGGFGWALVGYPIPPPEPVW